MAVESISEDETLAFFIFFFSALILASDSSTTSISFLTDFPHSECGPTIRVIQSFFSSLWNAKLPITYA